jgi:hypothetical protein
VTETIEWDAFLPQGLCGITEKGKLKQRSVQVELQYRDIENAGAWTSELRTYTGATLDQIGYTESITLP